MKRLLAIIFAITLTVTSAFAYDVSYNDDTELGETRSIYGYQCYVTQDGKCPMILGENSNNFTYTIDGLLPDGTWRWLYTEPYGNKNINVYVMMPPSSWFVDGIKVLRYTVESWHGTTVLYFTRLPEYPENYTAVRDKYFGRYPVELIDSILLPLYNGGSVLAPNAALSLGRV